MTYDELKTNIANFMNRSDLTNQMDTFIKSTEGEINRILRHKDMTKRANANADTRFMQLPSDFLNIINVELTGGEGFTPLFQKSIESLDVYRKTQSNAAGKPKFFAVLDDAIELCPSPDTNYELQLTYNAKLSALSSTNTSNFVSEDYPDIYIYGSCKHASVYLMDDDRAVLFSRQFEKALEELRLQQERASYGKGSLIPRRRTYGRSQKQNYYYKN